MTAAYRRMAARRSSPCKILIIVLHSNREHRRDAYATLGSASCPATIMLSLWDKIHLALEFSWVGAKISKIENPRPPWLSPPDLLTHKLFNRGQRSCDGGRQFLAAVEGVTGDRDKERTRTGLEYGLCVSQQTHRRQMMPERMRRFLVRIDGLTLPASRLADERRIDENHEFDLAYELGQFRGQLIDREHLDSLVLDRRS